MHDHAYIFTRGAEDQTQILVLAQQTLWLASCQLTTGVLRNR